MFGKIKMGSWVLIAVTVCGVHATFAYEPCDGLVAVRTSTAQIEGLYEGHKIDESQRDALRDMQSHSRRAAVLSCVSSKQLGGITKADLLAAVSGLTDLRRKAYENYDGQIRGAEKANSIAMARKYREWQTADDKDMASKIESLEDLLKTLGHGVEF